MIISGWLVLDKPLNMTSAQLVAIVKKKLSRFTNEKIKIGHTGTLDPLATGVLPLALGEATKLAQFFLDCHKSYEFTIAWGQKTNTADKEGYVIAETDNIPSETEIKNTILKFIGEQAQIPHKFSSLKVDGRRAYDLARQNIDFELPKRLINIASLNLLSHDATLQESLFSVTCSKGTYVRTLAEDIADSCHSLGHLKTLRRTKVGFFSEKHAILPDISDDLLYKSILAMTDPLNGISAININQNQEQALRFGQSIIWGHHTPNGVIFPAVNDNQSLVALVSFIDGKIVPRRVFNI